MSRTNEPFLQDAARPEAPEPLKTAHMIELTELGTGDGKSDNQQQTGSTGSAPVLGSMNKVGNPLRHIRTKLTICVGTAEVTVGELLDAKANQVLRLDRKVEEPVDILLEGQVVARGTLVAVDDYFAVRIIELPVSFDTALNMHTNS